MTDENSSPELELLRKVYIAGDIGPLEDGFCRYFTGKGALNAWELRTIADELDRRNEAWDKQVQQDLKKLADADNIQQPPDLS